MRSLPTPETMRPAGATEEAQPTPTRPVPRPVLSVAAAGLALAAGAGLVSAAIAWTPTQNSPQALARGAQLYAAECASCHGSALEGQAAPNPPDIAAPRPPPLGASGHAWQHSDAELKAIVARGIGAALPPAPPNMPAFAQRLGSDEIDAILAYLKSRWPVGVSAYQATLNPDGGKALAKLLRDPTWSFPSQCSPPAAMGDP